jgi:glycerophosphoryl diester phosphodiesterase
MDTIKIKKGNVRMIAHRGVSGLETENTCAAFVAAGNRSYTGIETDIHVNPDGCFVIMHDKDTKRLLGESHNIEQEPMSQLRALVLPDIDGSRVRSDLRLPTLEEYLSICRKYEKIAVLEIKGLFSPESLDNAVSVVKSYEYLERTIFISFNLSNLTALKEKYPKLKIQYLTDEWDDTLPDKLRRLGMGLDIDFHQLTSQRIKTCHTKGVDVNCWTVNKPEDGERLASWGVDFITSNILE